MREDNAAVPTRRRLPLLGERSIIVVLCYTYFLNYIDRGIVPGAPESFQSFTTKTLGVPETDQSVYFGLLSSAFIAATAFFSVVFGSLAVSIRPFKLIAIGMSAWVVAVIISGVAYYADSYYLLVVGRAISGIGEASIQCNAMPFVNSHAPQKNRTLWLGGMVASITVGMAAGYVYGSAFASSSLGWAWSFFVEALLMLPPIMCFLYCIPDSLNVLPTDTTVVNHDMTDALAEPGEDSSPVGDYAIDGQDMKGLEQPKIVKRTWRDWVYQFKNIPFTLVVVGYTCYTVAITAFSIFSPILFIGMGFYDDESSASFMFGVIVLICGTIGTVGGAMMLDHMTKGQLVTREHRRKLAIDLLCYSMSIGAAAGLVMMLFTDNETWFHVWLGIAFMFMSGIGPAQSVAVIESFPESRQAMAVATNTVVLLLLGQVPTPLIIGWLKDTWAPLCGTVDVNGDAQLNPDCNKNRSGLNDVLLFSTLWLPAAALLWAIAKFAVFRMAKAATTKELSIASSPRS